MTQPGLSDPNPTMYAPPPPSIPSSGRGFAIASLILGILGLLELLTPLRAAFTIICLLLAIAGIICGHIAYSRLRTDRGLAIAALIVSYIALGLGLLHLLGLVALAGRLRRLR
jgi:hypothetical protein